MKTVFFLFLTLGLTVFISCNEGDLLIAVDPAIQRAVDVEIINEYLIKKGYDPDLVDTTEFGVRYIIIDEGDPLLDSIDESDIVEFDYIGRLTNDSLFDTSIESVALASSTDFDSTKTFFPLLINYSASGWTVSGRFINGFSDGVSATLGGMHIGGRALIVFPSDLGYGSVPQSSNSAIETIPAYSVLTFELFPVRVDKQ